MVDFTSYDADGKRTKREFINGLALRRGKDADLLRISAQRTMETRGRG
jgi:hypothetical protein